MKKVILFSVKFVCFFIVSFLLTQTTLAQSVSSIMGKVLDSTGESVIGASVLVKGTTSGTITDIDGNFKLDNVPANATLVVSYIGYQTQEIPGAGKKNLLMIHKLWMKLLLSDMVYSESLTLQVLLLL